jgi:hypothetical protein
MNPLPTNRRLKEQVLKNQYGYTSIRGVAKNLNLFNNKAVYEYLENKYNKELKDLRAKDAVNAFIEKRKAINAKQKIDDFLRNRVIHRNLITPDFIQFNPPANKKKCYDVINESNVLIQPNSITPNLSIYHYKNLKSIGDIRERLISLYHSQKKGFKISILFDFMFEKRDFIEDERRFEYKYINFRAKSNTYFISAVNVDKIEDIRAINLDKELLENYILSMRPSSSHKIIGIIGMTVKILNLKKYQYLPPNIFGTMEWNEENMRNNELTRLKKQNPRFVGAKIELPDYITKNKNIVSMNNSINNMCFWNCLAFHYIKKERCLSKSNELFTSFYNQKPSKIYQGIDMNSEIDKYECIESNIGINIYDMNEAGKYSIIRKSNKTESLNLLIFKNHFCYIVNVPETTEKIDLPDYIKDNKDIISMSESKNNMSFWDCAGYFLTQKQDCREFTKELFDEFYPNQSSKDYKGFDVVNDMKRFESYIALEIYEILEDLERGEIWVSSVPLYFKDRTNLRLNLIKQGNQENQKSNNHSSFMRILQYKFPDGRTHYSYIKDIQNIQKCKHSCKTCGNTFKDSLDLKRHIPTCEDFKQSDKFVKFSQVYEPKRNLIIELNEIFNTDYDFKFEPVIVYDFEALVLPFDNSKVKEKKKKDEVEDKTKITNEQRAVSVSICSNIEGYETPKCIINESVETLFKEMFDYLKKITEKAVGLMREKYNDLIEIIESLDDGIFKDSYYKQLLNYTETVPVIGFNSGKYDINLNINEFMRELLKLKRTEEEEIFSIKNGNTFKVLKCGNLMFLDICQYLPPTYNLDAYIKAFNKDGLKKGIFPYEYMDSFEKVDSDINLLTKETFFSKLKNKGITKEEWEEFEFNKSKYNWKTLRDLLIYYNNLDVKPFLDAILENKKFFYDLKIDMFKDGMSLPSLAEKTMFSFCFKEFNEVFIYKQIEPFNEKNYSYEFRIDDNNKIIPFMIKDNGKYILDDITESSIKQKLESYKQQDEVSNRYEEDEFIEKEEITDLFKLQNCRCKYCWTDLYSKSKINSSGIKKVIIPDGKIWTLDRVNNDLGHNKNNCVLSCLTCNIQRKDENYNIFYRKKALVRYSYKNPLIYLIDEENKIVFEKLKSNITGGASIVFHRHHEAELTKIKRPIYNMDTQDWEIGNEGKTVKNITGFDANALYLWCIGQSMPCGKLQWTEWKDGVEQNTINNFINEFNGFVEVDIYTPKNLYNEMGEFPLIFKNIEYDSYEVMGDYMKTLYEEEDKDKVNKKRITKKLISSFKGDKILIKSDRLKWLISKGLIVSKIYGSIKTEKGVIFEGFVKKVSDERRKGDINPDYAIIAEMWKLLGNSAFGRTGMNKNKFSKTTYGDETKYEKCVKSILLEDVNQYGDLYEITMKSRNVRQNIPIQVACSIYDDSKLLMSKFYYDCLSKYISRDDFQYVEMDTDSAYMGLTGDFFTLIKPDMLEEFKLDKNNWFLRDDTEEHKKFDKRKAGLFKPEFIGEGIVALCSKSYFVSGFEKDRKKGKDNFKLSCKGVQRNNNEDKITMNSYKDVLYHNVKSIVKNRGMRIMNDNMIYKAGDEVKQNRKIYNYEVDKIGLSGKYDKRRILNDGVSSVPLNI